MKREQEEILIRAAEIAVGKIPTGYVEHCGEIWEAFLLGRKFAQIDTVCICHEPLPKTYVDEMVFCAGCHRPRN